MVDISNETNQLMERKKTEKPNWEERTDPNANPLTSFGQDDVFTDELIKGICKKNETVSLASDENTNNSALQKRTVKPDGNATIKKKRSTRKKRCIR
jgi:hypothetical protein|tara:strand:+ start:605 stop:895 length:291 start_codon:yes stop_codon:yes gene_type:complete